MRVERMVALGGLAVLFAAWPIQAGAQANAPRASAQRDATRMYEAFRVDDLHAFAKYTYPGLLKLMGGTERMIAHLQAGRADMRRQGYAFRSAEAGLPLQVVTAGTELHAILPLRQVLTAPGGELHIDGFLLGISSAEGRTWTFIDTARLTEDTVRQVLPHYNPALRIPPRREPTFVPR